MRIGVALLGAQVSVASLKEIGLKGVVTVAIVVSFTIFGILGLSKLFKMSGDLGLLIGVGFGVCGATAVAAIRPQTRATEEETSYAIGLISLCGTLSIFLLPFLGHVLNLDTREFGSWAEAAVHDVGQVVATASVWGDGADKYATFHNLVEINARVLADIVFTSKLLLGAGLVALGSGVRWKSIRAIGPRPMAMGMIAWVIVAGVALAAVKVTGL